MADNGFKRGTLYNESVELVSVPMSTFMLLTVDFHFHYTFSWNLQDGDLAEASRWACAPKLGGECTISYDLGAVRIISELRLGEVAFTAVTMFDVTKLPEDGVRRMSCILVSDQFYLLNYAEYRVNDMKCSRCQAHTGIAWLPF